MKNNHNELSSGNDSTNVQGRDHVTLNQTNNYGVLAGEARQIAMDVFKANFFELSQNAHEIALRRAEELTDQLIEKLKNEKQSILEEIKNPDMQYAIFEAQKSYVRLGDKELMDLLVDLLVKRTTEQNNTFFKLTLNEALTVIPKLTKKQIDILSVIYMIKYLNYNVPIQFIHYYQTAKHFLDGTIDIPENQIFYQHLQYSGCISISIGSLSFKDALVHKLPYVFSGDADKKLLEITVDHPEMIHLERKWDNTKLCNSSLTSVGIIIAMININKKLGYNWDLKMWINEE